jgi:hypothetical protein
MKTMIAIAATLALAMPAMAERRDGNGGHGGENERGGHHGHRDPARGYDREHGRGHGRDHDRHGNNHGRGIEGCPACDVPTKDPAPTPAPAPTPSAESPYDGPQTRQSWGATFCDRWPTDYYCRAK